MINKFDPNTPATESRLLSEPIRNNFNALNDRTNQLTPAATFPVSTSIRIGTADKIYFEDNTYVPFTGGLIDLGSITTGVSPFNTPGTFKEIIIYYYNSGGSGTLGFIESIEKFTKVRNTQDLINNASSQVDPMSGQNGPSDPNLLKGRIPICSIVVTNNGTAAQRGQIVQLGDVEILDIRPFMQRGGGIEDLEAHINAPTLADAHPSALIDNASLSVTGRGPFSTVPVVGTPVIAGSKQIFVNGNVNLFTVGQFVRIPTTAVPGGIANVTNLVEFITAQIVFIDAGVTPYIIVDRPLPAIPSGRLIINGLITLDRMGFDVATALAEVTMDTFLRIETNLSDESVYKLGLDIVYDENVAPTAAIDGTKIDPNFGSQNVTTSGVTTLTNTTQSTSSVTGALIVSGGVGVAKNVYIGQQLNVTGLATFVNAYASGHVEADGYLEAGLNQNATSLTTGALRVTAGGASITQDLRVGGFVYTGTTPIQLTDAAGKILSAALNTVQVAQGGTGLTSLGTSNQVLGVNSAGTSAEYKTISGTANRVTVTHGSNLITLSGPQDIATTSSPTFAGLTVSGIGTGVVKATSGTLSTSAVNLATEVTGLLPLTNGGTNKNMTAVAGGIIWTDADSMEVSTAGTTGQALLSGGTTAPTWFTATGVVKAASGVLSTSNVDLTSEVTGLLPLANGGTNKNMTVVNGGIVWTDTNSMEVTVAGTAGQPLLSGGAGTPTWFSSTGVVKATSGILSTSNVVLGTETTGTLPVAQGGTGLSSLGTANQIIGINGAGTAAEYKTVSGTANRVTVTHGAGTITLSTPQDIATTSSPTFAGLTISGLTTGVVKSNGSGVLSSSAVNLATETTGTLAITQGGTGQVTATAAFTALAPSSTQGALIYKGPTDFASLSIGTANYVLTSSGTAPTWTLLVDANIDASAGITRSKLAATAPNEVVINDPSGFLTSEAQLSVTRGGTGLAAIPAGELLAGNGTSPAITIGYTATNAGDTIVARDSLGNFAAGDVTVTNLYASDGYSAPSISFVSSPTSGLSYDPVDGYLGTEPSVSISVQGQEQVNIFADKTRFRGGMVYNVRTSDSDTINVGMDDYILITTGTVPQTVILPADIYNGTAYKIYCRATDDTFVVTPNGFEINGKVATSGIGSLTTSSFTLTQGEATEIVMVDGYWHFMSFLSDDNV